MNHPKIERRGLKATNPGLPDSKTVSGPTLISPKGQRYRTIKTTEKGSLPSLDDRPQALLSGCGCIRRIGGLNVYVVS